MSSQAAVEKKDGAGYAWVILWVAFIASVAAPLAQMKISPIMPVLMQEFGLNTAGAGMLMSVFAITGFILALSAGLIMMKFGVKTTALIAMGSVVLGSVLGALATSSSFMLITRLIEGIGMGLIGVVAPAVISMWFPPEKRGGPMGIWATWVPVGMVLMFVLAPAINGAMGWRAVFWFSAIFGAVAFVLVFLFLKAPPLPPAGKAGGPPLEGPPDMKKALSIKDIWLLAASFGFFNMALIAISTFYPTFLNTVKGLDMGQASLISAITMVVVIFSAPLAGILSDKIGSRKKLFTFPFIVVALMMFFPFNISIPLVIVWMILMGIIAGAIPTATFAAVPEIMKSPALVGIGMAVVAVGQNLGQVLGGVVFGALVDSSGWVAAGIWMVPVLLLGLAAGWLIKVR